MKNIYSIIVTYNGSEWIEKCINSLITSSYPTNIVVIDNGSTDLTVFIIKNKFPSVQLIETGKNAGFGQANNIGFEIAIKNEADYVFLLNQDAWVETECLRLLVEAHLNQPALGIISPIHLNGKGSGLDKYFMNYLLESASREHLSSKFLDQNGASHDELISTQFVNAAAWLISSGCLKKTGGFDRIFFHYGEDRDYAQRVIYWGFKIGIVVKAKIYHDREERILLSANNPKISERVEWIHFLNQACNIHNINYRMLIVKRFLRHCLQLCITTAAMNRDKIRLNFFMARNIAGSFRSIRACRKRSLHIG